ncbi:hypothetical protein JCM9279_005601 [Rhodotorula babjevae]
MLPRNPPIAPARRSHVLLIALAALVFHVWLARKLGAVQTGLASTLGDDETPTSGSSRDDGRDLEGAEWRRLEGVRALLGIGKLWSWCSAGIAGVGIYGLLRDRLPLLRLFVLNGFLAISLDLLLLALILLLLTVSSPSSSRGLATTLCGTLSLSFSLPDLLGSLEACEDRFEGVVVTALGALALVQGLRVWGAVKVLGFYTLRASPRGARSRSGGGRGGHGDEQEFYDSPVELDGSPGRSGLSRSGSGKKKRRDSHGARRERSSSMSSVTAGAGASSSSGRRRDETRIFLLPRPEDRGKRHLGGEEDALPLIALTASSPIRTSFPPSSSTSSYPSPHALQHPPPSPGRDDRRVLVYAPVMVSASEARSLGATELVLHGPGRTHPAPPSPGRNPPAAAASLAGPARSPRSRSATITPGSSSSSASTPTPTASSSATLVLDTGPGAGSSAAGLQGSARPSRQDSDDLLTPLASTSAERERQLGLGGVAGAAGEGELGGGAGRAKRA